MPGPREALAENGSVFLDLVNFGDFPSILVARPPKKPFWHPTEAVPIPHTTTRALPPPTPTAAVHTRTVRGTPRAAGATRVVPNARGEKPWDQQIGETQAEEKSAAHPFEQRDEWQAHESRALAAGRPARARGTCVRSGDPRLIRTLTVDPVSSLAVHQPPTLLSVSWVANSSLFGDDSW